PEDYQRSLGKQYIDAGADVVIGSHPHVLQGVEYYKGKPIVYSLGNFIFGSSIPKTALLKVQWDGQASQLTFVPGTSSAGYTRVLENEAQKADFASYMTGISYGVTIEDDGTVVPQG
ncbi:MAG: CapA family protein, partial [Clostridium sp.]